MTEWKPEKNISSPWDANVWENNIGQPVLNTYSASVQNNTYIQPQGTLKIGPSGYKIDPKKLAKAPQRIWSYFFGAFYFTEEFEYFDIVKPYLDIPEQPKTLDEIQQEFDEKIDKLIKITKGQFEYSKIYAEKGYDYKFDKIIENFEYAKEHGEFRPKLKLSYTATGLSAGSYETSFVIKQGNKHEGYYTFGNGRYFKYYMPTKPNVIARFFMKTCLGFFWVDDEVL